MSEYFIKVENVVLGNKWLFSTQKGATAPRCQRSPREGQMMPILFPEGEFCTEQVPVSQIPLVQLWGAALAAHPRCQWHRFSQLSVLVKPQRWWRSEGETKILVMHVAGLLTPHVARHHFQDTARSDGNHSAAPVSYVLSKVFQIKSRRKEKAGTLAPVPITCRLLHLPALALLAAWTLPPDRRPWGLETIRSWTRWSLWAPSNLHLPSVIWIGVETFNVHTQKCLNSSIISIPHFKPDFNPSNSLKKLIQVWRIYIAISSNKSIHLNRVGLAVRAT